MAVQGYSVTASFEHKVYDQMFESFASADLRGAYVSLTAIACEDGASTLATYHCGVDSAPEYDHDALRCLIYL